MEPLGRVIDAICFLAIIGAISIIIGIGYGCYRLVTYIF